MEGGGVVVVISDNLCKDSKLCDILQESIALDEHKALWQLDKFAGYGRSDHQFCMFKNYQLTYTHYTKIPAPFPFWGYVFHHSYRLLPSFTCLVLPLDCFSSSYYSCSSTLDCLHAPKNCQLLKGSCDRMLASDWLEKTCDCGEIQKEASDLVLDFPLTYFWLSFKDITLLVFCWQSTRGKHKFWIRFCLVCCKPR